MQSGNDKNLVKSTERRPALLLAEFDTPADVVHAASKVRDAGYKKWDTHTPFPVHGMDAAMGLPDSRIGFIVLIMGLMGTSGAALMIWWMNAIDYPIIIGGKPPGSIPTMIPVMFELTILLSAFGAFFGMLHLNRLPRHHHPVFYSDRFAAASNDKFYISIEVEDPLFDLVKTRKLIDSLLPSYVELVEEEVAYGASLAHGTAASGGH